MTSDLVNDICSKARWWIAPLVGWTLFLWSSRIRNVLADDDLDAFGLTWRLGAAVIFLAMGLACALWLWKGRPGAISLGVLAGWTVIYWLVRGTGIMLDSNHDAGFKAIHAALMAMSLGLVLVAAHGVRKVANRHLPVAP
ncbi:MAG: hypothetical protein P8N02_02835 [Actinomycetota bacterium]|nr:hypothetical protein [Actinomycetota bacterium]